LTSRTARHNVAPFPPKRTDPSCTCGPQKTRGPSVVCAGADQHTSLCPRQSRAFERDVPRSISRTNCGVVLRSYGARRHVLRPAPSGVSLPRDGAFETALPPARNRQPSHLASTTTKREPPSGVVGDSAWTRAPMAVANSETMASPRPEPNCRLGPRSAR
jgi:hypothetical protein